MSKGLSYISSKYSTLFFFFFIIEWENDYKGGPLPFLIRTEERIGDLVRMLKKTWLKVAYFTKHICLKVGTSIKFQSIQTLKRR
jgi:hypothetical protein